MQILCKKATRSLLKDIGEFASYQRPISNALRKHFGADPKLKIVWLFVTSNLIWSASDRSRAEAQNIQIIEERELRYFEEIAKNVGPAAKYQFLGEFLSNQKIPELANYSVPAIRTKLGGHWAYYFLAPPSRMLPISFVNHRGLRDIEGAPAYQRVLKRSRLKEIGSYLDGGGFFPNCILVNFRDDVRYEKQSSFEDRQISFGNLFLPDRFKTVWIIDGQHRLFGFTEASKDSNSQTLPVLAFEKLSTVAEAELFATINSKQQKVARGLLDELAGELKLTSDDFSERMGAIASRALDMMATESGSPFEDRMKTADLADSETICLTISEIKKAIISARLLGSMSRTEVEIPGPFSRRNTKETLNALCEGLTAYFSLIQSSNPDRWDLGKPGYLCSNVAIQGYIRLLQALIEFMSGQTGQEPSNLDSEELIDQVKPFLNPVLEFVATTEDADFSKRFKQPFGSGGPPRYFHQLCLIVRTQFPDFAPQGFAEFATEQASEISERADVLTKTLVDRVHRHVITVLKTAYAGDHFDKGIPQKDIKLSAMNKKYEDGDGQMPAENYLDVIDLKKIVEHQQNWDLFKESMDIKLVDDRKGQAKYVKWLERLNEVRRFHHIHLAARTKSLIWTSSIIWMNSSVLGMCELTVQLKPFLKWAGGKRWLTSRHGHLLPTKYKAYHEPFLGSGAVFFHLQPERAFLSDANVHLIECYLALKEDWQSVWNYLLAFKREHSEEYYYQVREAAFRSPSREAARFIYLNRTCFNGIYRENLKGIFNVPKGTKDAVTFPDDNFSAVSLALQSASLKSSDFAVAIDQAKRGDFVFIDPPYTVRHNHNGFVKYNQKIFNWADQVRLRDAVRLASERGVSCLITNACHPSIVELYEGLGKKSIVSRSSVIAGTSKHRGTYEELIITIGYDVCSEGQDMVPGLFSKQKKKLHEERI